MNDLEVIPGKNPVDEVYEITDEQINNTVLYQQLVFFQDQNGIQVGIDQVPVPKELIEEFKRQFDEEMAKENLKLVIVKGKLFLAPFKQSSLIGFN